MRFKITRAFAYLSMTAVLATAACSSKPVKKDETPAQGAVESTPTATVTDKPMDTDPMGSDSGRISGLSTVFFEYDKDRLTTDARKKLADNAEWIKGHANFTIQVEGHTDARGSIEYNLALGERRAKSVKTYLQSLSIDPKRVTIISYGKEKPLDSGDGESAWSKNRRANFVPLQ